MRRLSILLALTLAASSQPLLAAPAPKAPFLFSRPAAAPGVYPRQGVLADMDEDGRADMVSGVGTYVPSDESCRGCGVSVMAGRAAGSFGAARLAPTSGRIQSLQVADVNGDENLDAFTAQLFDGQDRYPGVVLPGNGDGTMGEVIDMPFPPFASATMGRFEAGETFPGALVSGDDGLIYWRGYGGFGFVETRAVGSDLLAHLVAADFDGDGVDEAVGATTDGTIHLYRGLTRVASATQLDVRGLRVADVNADGTPEVLATSTDGAVRAYNGSLSVVRSLPGTASGRQTAAGDLDGDGKVDLVRAEDGTPLLTVAFGKGGAGVNVALAKPAVDVHIADGTGDGIPDILAIEEASSTVEIIEGDGAGAFSAQRGTQSSQANGWTVRLADFNADGKQDFIAGELNWILGGYTAFTTATAFVNDGTGKFIRKGTVSTQGSSTGLDVGDVNGDGKQDAVVSDYHQGAVSWYQGNGDGTFGPRIPVPGTCSFNDGVATGDFNGDAYTDAVSMCRTAIFKSHLSIALGSPAGLLPGAQISYTSASQPYVIRTGDLNGDGRDDIALGAFDHNFDPNCTVAQTCPPFESGSRPVDYLIGLGNGVFEPHSKSYVIRKTFVDVQLADVNGDGRDDVITPLPYEDQIQIALGKADGTLGEPYAVAALDNPWEVKTGDLTGDGIVDLVTSQGPDMIAVSPGLGGGQFGDPTGYATRTYAGEPFVANLNGDGKRDVLVSGGSFVEVFLQGV